ncbi:MAG: uroporphyrinogen-III synthase [Candidatus Acidiferrales bacterium]
MAETEKPLAGKRIVVTRAPAQAQELTRSLERMGAEVLLLPMVAFAPPDDWSAVDAALRAWAQFDWVLFTSRNAVRFLRGRATQLGATSQFAARTPKTAAVGPATAAAAGAEGFRVDYVAEEHSGAGLARELRDALAGKGVLLPRSDLADSRLPEALREIGSRVTEVVAYRTVAPELPDPAILADVRAGRADAILFSSASAFHNFMGFIGASELTKLSERVAFAAIGPSTAAAIRGAGVRVEIEAEESSADGLASSLAHYYERSSHAARRA